MHKTVLILAIFSMAFGLRDHANAKCQGSNKTECEHSTPEKDGEGGAPTCYGLPRACVWTSAGSCERQCFP